VKNIHNFKISDLDCPDCAAKIEKHVSAINGVKSAQVNLMKSTLTVEFTNQPDLKAVERCVKELGHVASSSQQLTPPQSRNWQLRLTIISGLFTAAGIFHYQWHGSDSLTIPLYVIAILCGGFYVFRKGVLALKNLSADMNLLMSIAVIGAAVIGEWDEGATAMFLFSLANLLESYSMDRARNSIRKLMDISPKQALIHRDGKEIIILVSEVKVGEIIIIKPGGNIPLDGKIVAGTSSINQAAITGESLPLEKIVGDEVFAGTLNQRGTLEVKVTKLFEDTELARIIHLVEEAQAQRAPSQNFVDKFAKYYTPIVVGSALLVAVLPTLLFHAPFTDWFYRALVMLVIACPCALVISTPVTIVSGLARAAWSGILIKGGAHLENAGKLKCIALDKTGTLTVGKPQVENVIVVNGIQKTQLISVAATLESRSEHHLATAITEFSSNNGNESMKVDNFEAFPGKGVKGMIGGIEYFLGSHAMFEEMGICDSKVHDTLSNIENSHQSAVLVGRKDLLLGIFAVTDQIREGAEEVIADLKKNGISHTVMLTGDNHRTAQAIGHKLGLDEIRSELLPQDKVAVVRELKEKYQYVAMVGDGVNDAPALAAASMGIAMGTAGTDAALETADVALMADDLTRLPLLMTLGRKTLFIIKQNVTLAIGIKVVFLALAIPGLTTLWMAVFADMGASLLVIFNGLRMLRK